MFAIIRQNDERRRVHVVGTGQLTVPDALAYFRERYGSGTWGYSTLVDVRDAAFDVSPQEARRTLPQIQAIGRGEPRGPIAIVTNSDLIFGTARMFAAHAEQLGIRYGVFREMANAERWLDEMEKH